MKTPPGLRANTRQTSTTRAYKQFNQTVDNFLEPKIDVPRSLKHAAIILQKPKIIEDDF